jgi:hypothetical protein
MVAIDAGNVYITDGTVSGNTISVSGNQKVVKIDATKIDYNLNNAVTVIPIPISRGNRGNTPYSRVIDLKRIKEVISIQGFLPNEPNESDITKRNNLIYLAQKGGELTVVWGKDYSTNKYQTLMRPPPSGTDQNLRGVFIMKLMFTETAGYMGEEVGGATNEEPSERNISVQVQLVRGKDM